MRMMHAKCRKVEVFEIFDPSIYALNEILEIARPPVDCPRHSGSALLKRIVWIVIICPDAAAAPRSAARCANIRRLGRSHASGDAAEPQCRSRSGALA